MDLLGFQKELWDALRVLVCGSVEVLATTWNQKVAKAPERIGSMHPPVAHHSRNSPVVYQVAEGPEKCQKIARGPLEEKNKSN